MTFLKIISQLLICSTLFAFSKADLEKWDQVVADQFEDSTTSLFAFRIYTYLYQAQIQAAELDFHENGYLAGSLDPISYAMIALFLPDIEKPDDYCEDAYSVFLKDRVLPSLRARMEKENHLQLQFSVPKEKESSYFVGLGIAKWIPWHVKPSMAFWPPPPPPENDFFWIKQIDQIYKAREKMTEQKKKAIYLWAGLSAPGKSNWRIIANDYLFSHTVPLWTTLQVRSLLTKALYDALIVSFSAKYHYLVKRPSERDLTLHHEIPVPHHPSYPSNHSLTSTVAANLLSYFFPCEEKHWHQLQNTACLSRIWAGIHYPIDDQNGREAGEKVSKEFFAKYFKTSPNQAKEVDHHHSVD